MSNNLFVKKIKYSILNGKVHLSEEERFLKFGFSEGGFQKRV